jgi:hydrocephalus-inducing protein
LNLILFIRNEIGKFEQLLQFEIVGSKSKYSVMCTGNCRYSQIVSETRKIFPKWKKGKEDKYISHGDFISSTNTFEFGPLLYSKPREKYLEKFPENRAILNICNSSHHDIKVLICLRNDIKSEVFFFEPQSMDLVPGQSQNLQIWAYPRSANFYEDTLIICIKDNPEPYCYKISCTGVKPELEIDKRQLSFDKLLIGRSEKRDLKLKNNTLMPVAWKLAQVEVLGDEFTVSPLEGVIEPFQEQLITAEFKGFKPVVISRRSIRLEVSDHEKIGGVVQEVPILVTAEAYDIAMDLHFPKGFEGGLDFGVFKVMEEGKQLLTLKNKGKYEVGFRYIFDNKDLANLFTVAPQQGIMQPSDKPFPVQVIFKANREISVRDFNNLKCQFFEPTTGEVTATVPIKLMARAVFSRYSIMPARDLNFGALIHGSKVSRQFTIENLGEFDFRYSIYKIVQGLNDYKSGANSKLKTNRLSRAYPARSNSPPNTTTGAIPSQVNLMPIATAGIQASKIPARKDVVKQADAANFGAFTVFPTNGIIPYGTKHQITVEFHSDNPGSFEEIVAVDISDRSPNDFDVLEYRLVGETCVPGINTTDFASIFEEHTVCKRLELFNTQGNIYAEEDRVFYFGAYLAGQQAQVRFKISNPYKVPCDINISTKPRSRTKSDAADFAFDVEPKKITIPSHEYRYVTVSFHPMLIQSYAGIFEALVENSDQTKSKTLIFELRGEGTLPRISIEKPNTKNKNGYPSLKFRRLLIGSSQVLPLVLKNEGITMAKVKLEWLTKETEEFECIGMNSYHTLRPQESRAIDVKCRALSIGKFEAEMKVRVLDNSFEDSIIQMNGEGYMDEVTFDNLPGKLNSICVLDNIY